MLYEVITGLRSLYLAVICGLGLCALSAAAAPGEPPKWEFGAAVYGWFPDISGSTVFQETPGGGDFRIDIEDILDNLQFTFMGRITSYNVCYTKLLRLVNNFDTGRVGYNCPNAPIWQAGAAPESRGPRVPCQS